MRCPTRLAIPLFDAFVLGILGRLEYFGIDRRFDIGANDGTCDIACRNRIGPVGIGLNRELVAFKGCLYLPAAAGEGMPRDPKRYGSEEQAAFKYCAAQGFGHFSSRSVGWPRY